MPRALQEPGAGRATGKKQALSTDGRKWEASKQEEVLTASFPGALATSRSRGVSRSETWLGEE